MARGRQSAILQLRVEVGKRGRCLGPNCAQILSVHQKVALVESHLAFIFP